MASKNADRLERYKVRLRAAGFKRLSFWTCSDLATLLAAERRPGECGGRTLERLLLGAATKRPEYWSDEERVARKRIDNSNKLRTRRREGGSDDPPPVTPDLLGCY